MVSLDTNILIIGLKDGLGGREMKVVGSVPCGISAMVIWALVYLTKLGRLVAELDDSDLAKVLDTFHVWPVTAEIAHATNQLDFRSDPADQLIAATSIVHNAPLVTRDRTIRASTVMPLAV